ncbi:MAG: hypothetical protein AAB334_00450 [Patescibacteria group bacterium]
MNKIKKEFLENFSKKFNLPILNQSEEKFHFEAKEMISSEVIDKSVQKFFEGKGYSLKEILPGGFFFFNEKERIIVTITNYSGKYPFSIFVSVD